jgi:hypothetical protein
MRSLQVTICVIVAAGCGQGSSQERQHFHLALSASDSSTRSDGVPTMTMTGGDSRVLELVVVGSVSGPVTFSGKLPPFATLKGPLVTLSPARRQAGTFTLEITASDGKESATSVIEVVVEPYNTAPRAQIRAWYDDTPGMPFLLWRSQSICPSPSTCTSFGTPQLWVGVCDDEDDAVTAAVEVVPRGQPFTNVPTHALTAPAGSGRPFTVSAGHAGVLTGSYCQGFTIVLSDLAADQSYDFAIKVSDQSAAGTLTYFQGPSIRIENDGWGHSPAFGFDTGPCTSRRCACMADHDSGCEIDAHCCSGKCVNRIVGPEQMGTCAP